MSNTSILEMKGRLTHTDPHKIRDDLTKILNGGMNLILLGFTGLSKLLYLMIILVIYDAVQYLHTYQTDESFDNYLIGHDLVNYWKVTKKEKLTPMRRWELKENFHYYRDRMLSEAEKWKMMMAVQYPLFLTIIIALVCAADWGLIRV